MLHEPHLLGKKGEAHTWGGGGGDGQDLPVRRRRSLRLLPEHAVHSRGCATPCRRDRGKARLINTCDTSQGEWLLWLHHAQCGSCQLGGRPVKCAHRSCTAGSPVRCRCRRSPPPPAAAASALRLRSCRDRRHRALFAASQPAKSSCLQRCKKGSSGEKAILSCSASGRAAITLLQRLLARSLLAHGTNQCST